MTFGEKLKNLRGQNGITQDELAEKLYVTRTAVSKWENDRGLPTIDTMKQIAELFGVTLDELVSDDDVRSARLAEERAAKRFRIPALVCLAAAFALAFLTAYVSKWCSLPLIACTGGFIGCALLSRPPRRNHPPPQAPLVDDGEAHPRPAHSPPRPAQTLRPLTCSAVGPSPLLISQRLDIPSVLHIIKSVFDNRKFATAVFE